MAVAVALLPVDWHCINRILKSITQKNGRQVLRDCSAFLALSAVICICFFVCTFAHACKGKQLEADQAAADSD
ncbi:hypothetical protein [uncultured Oscillibacter sp.]|uniref:hypothetical protein n=1 Tax=uncultured Oscillibacter sp. TaxID=876091 RepID=UPI0025D17762|nr:hypothetical protein [uncultured Oscillibacter sp.]